MFVVALLSLLHAITVVNGAYTPRSIHARHAALLRARAPAPLPAPLVEPVPVVKKRDSKKCRPRPSSSTAAPTSTQIAPVNPGGDPNSSSTSPTQAPPPPPPTTHHAQPTPSPPSGGGSGSGGGGANPFGGFFSGVQTGELTFYELGLTACGETFSDDDLVAAVSHSLFDAVPGANGNPNDNPVCNHKVKINYQGGSVVVKVVDRCTGCAPTDLDLSPKAFSILASQSLGRLFGATWEWI